MKELPILQIDPLLRPYQGDLALRMENYHKRLAALLPDGLSVPILPFLLRNVNAGFP